MEHERPVVLVVDDDASIRAFVCDYLRENGFHSLGVNSAERAIALLGHGFAADLVFSDLRMPAECDGHALARWVAEHQPDLPVILTTGQENAAADPCHAETLPKPYELDGALARIRQTITGRKALG